MLLTHDLRKIVHDSAVAWRFMPPIDEPGSKTALKKAFEETKIAALRLDKIKSATAPDAQKQTFFKEIRDRIIKTEHYITWDTPIRDLLKSPGERTLEDLTKTIKRRVRRNDP